MICDCGNNKLRKLDLQSCMWSDLSSVVHDCSGEVKTICEMDSPVGIAITQTGSLIVSSGRSNNIRMISQKGFFYLCTSFFINFIAEGKYEAKILAGSGKAGHKDGAPLECEFNCPAGVAFDPKTNTCYVVDRDNHRIRKFTL